MSGNNLLNKSQPDVVRKQLIELLARVNKEIQGGNLRYTEEIYAAVLRAISMAGEDVYAPVFKPSPATTGTSPDPNHYNEIFNELVGDIFVAFEELKYTGDIAVSNYNRLVNEELALNAWTRKLFNKLNDLTLFSEDVIGRSTYATDDFVNFDFVDFEDRFTLGDMAFIDTDQGICTLPRENTASRLVIKEIKINNESNGNPGNNRQIDASTHDNIQDIYDDSSDTWYEYERVNIGVSSTPLIFSITITLAAESILNFIRVNPNNFGTSNWVVIDTIETSVDDKVYTSIRQSLDIEGFGDLLTDEDFTLAPSSSKFAGQGLFGFTPRKAKYVRMSFRQDQGYYIQTVAPGGTAAQGREGVQDRLRYAVGIRDIDIHGVNYVSAGSVVSLPFIFTDEIRKVSLQAVENPIRESTLASIEHFISLDDGARWTPIQPLHGEDPNIAKIVNINDGAQGSVSTELPAYEIRHKAVLTRLSDGFKDEKAAVQEELVDTYDLRQVPGGAPYQIQISNRPVIGSVRIFNPIFGSKGWQSPRLYVGTGDGTQGQRFEIRDIKIRPGEENLYVESQLWASVTEFNPSNDFEYVINYEVSDEETGEIFPVVTFGTTSSVPARNAVVTIEFPPEDVVVDSTAPHIMELESISDGDKSAVKVFRYIDPKHIMREIINPNASIMHLDNGLIDSGIGIIFNEPGLARFIAETPFVDGVTELSSPGDYSIDYTNGTVYLQGVSWETGITTVDYWYTPVVEVSPDYFDFVEGSSFKKLELDPTAFYSLKNTYTPGQNLRRILLPHDTVVRGSVVFSGSILIPLEIPFIDGTQEFSAIVDVDDESVPTSGTDFFLDNLPYSTDGTLATAFPVLFSDNTVFAVEIAWGGSPGAGEYMINYDTDDESLDYKKVETGSTLDGGTVSYGYQDPNAALNLSGTFSVDYREGIIYINTDQITATDTVVDYEYTQYAVKYRIAKEMDTSTFKVSPDDRLITILDPMILEDYVPTTRQAGLVKVVYQYVEQIRESIEELEPFFTPVLKAYALKLITSTLL